MSFFELTDLFKDKIAENPLPKVEEKVTPYFFCERFNCRKHWMVCENNKCCEDGMIFAIPFRDKLNKEFKPREKEIFDAIDKKEYL